MFKPAAYPAVKHRLFFALYPPELVARRMANWSVHRFGPHGVPVPAERLHVTLDILDDENVFPREAAERLIEASPAVAADPFFIEFDQVSRGGGSIALRPRLRNAAIRELVGRIAQVREAAGVAGRAGYRFNPHVTLMYRDGTPFAEMVTPFAWEAREFVLVHSLVGRTRHIRLGSWPLTGANPDQLKLF